MTSEVSFLGHTPANPAPDTFYVQFVYREGRLKHCYKTYNS